MQAQPAGATIADVTFTSPPYENNRTYSMGFSLKSQAWVDWLIPRVVEACRLTRGLVFINATGPVRKFKYSPVIEWLVADLTRHHGIVCGPAPYVFHRVGIPGSGAKHYHRRDWEPIYGFALPHNLPLRWADNTATGHPPKWAPGGEMSSRHRDGQRINAQLSKRANQWGHSINSDATTTDKDGVARSRGRRPPHICADKLHTKTMPDGTKQIQGYSVPPKANSGNVIHTKVGGGLMGSPYAHENEAPFPESLASFFVRSFCPPSGTIFDPFAGSGTTAAVAKKHSRNSISIDVRQSQCDIITQRISEIPDPLF